MSSTRPHSDPGADPPDSESAPEGQATERFAPNEFGPDTRGDFHVLKDGDLFAVFAATGDMNGPSSGPGELNSKDGLFFRDTRMLSRLVLSLGDAALIPMAVEADETAATLRCDLANARMVDRDGRIFPAYQIHVSRARFLSDGLFETIVVTNHGLESVALDLVFEFFADFRDIFEVRGAQRSARGEDLPPRATERGLSFGYLSHDGHHLITDVAFSVPVHSYQGRVRLWFDIAPGQSTSFDMVVRVCEKVPPEDHSGDQHQVWASHGGCDLAAPPPDREAARGALAARFAERVSRVGKISTDNPAFDAWLARSAADLAMLTADLSTGPYPHAGAPWFSVPFGRDGLITALQTLWLDTSLATGVLDFLAETQAKSHDGYREAEPGKILHETRGGELSRSGDVPFGTYYGGVDQTLLFVILAWEHYRRSLDGRRLRRLAPSIAAALDWARFHGDRDGDGLVEYATASDTGLRHQGWKDSDDAIFHADGRLAEGPIALVEVQAYHLAALRAAAGIFATLEDTDRAAECHARAEALESLIDTRFWDEDLGAYVLALDGDKAPIRVLSSNAGHVLFAGAAMEARVEPLVAALLGPDLATGWGVRTVAAGAGRFNPMGYHTGSIWPHDNSLIAAGLARYGRTEAAARITGALFDAANAFKDHRLPELWCGFSRTGHGRPVAYPSACTPQAWAAGSVFMCLQASLGLRLDPAARAIHASLPVLPPSVGALEVRGLDFGGDAVDLRFTRKSDGGAAIDVLAAPGDLRVILTPRRTG